MGAIEDFKNQFSLQDLGISTALGAVSGVIISKALGIPFSQTFVSGAFLGTASYITDLVPEEHMSPMRSTLFTVLTLGLAVFALTKAKTRFPSNILVRLLPPDVKPLVCVAALNTVGKTMIIYFPVVFPGFRTAPTLPKGLKDLFDLPTRDVRACHNYFDGNTDAFTDLPVKTQVALNHAFESASLTPFTATPFTASTFDDWEKEDLRMMREREISMGSVTTAFEQRCYAEELEPPKVVSVTFAIPATAGEISGLKKPQLKWFKALFDSHPAKWDELSPAKQFAFCKFDEFIGLVVRRPETVVEVTELDKQGVRLFHPDYKSSDYTPEVGLALVKRFSQYGLKLPENIQAQLAKLPDVASAAAVGTLPESEVALYELLFSQNPARWDSLDTTIRWAFRAKPGTWPLMGHPSKIGEIQGLTPDLIRYFHSSFNIEQTPKPSIREAWYLRFYECDLAPTPEMAQDCAKIFSASNNQTPFKNFGNVGEIQALSAQKLKWFEQTYRHFRAAWIALPLNYQTQFRKKASSELSFPTFTYPISVDRVESLDADGAEAFKEAFQMQIMWSKKGRGMLSWGADPLDDQNPSLFSLSDHQRIQILEALGKKLPSPLPTEFDLYIKPPTDPVEIRGLDKDKLQHWARYFSNNVEKWNALPLTLQIAYYQQAEDVHVAVTDFPAFFIRNPELKELVEKGNFAHAPTDATPPTLPADNVHYHGIQQLWKRGMFELVMWVRWPRETQVLLQTAFANLTFAHNNALVGGAIPPHPNAHGNVAGIAENLAKVYHENFYASAFDGADLDNFLQAFIAKFQENLPTHKVLGLGSVLLQKIDLEHMTDADRNWAQRILAHAGFVAWNELSCWQQVVYRLECHGFNGAGIPKDTHPYKAPALGEIDLFNREELAELRDFYNTGGPWMTLSPALQTALNERFVKEELGALPTPWTVDYSYADTKLVAKSPNADALRDYLADHRVHWDALDSRTQTKLNTKFTNNIPQDARFDLKKYYWARFRKNSSYSYQRYLEPHITRRNLMIGGLGTAYVVTELAGIPNGVPDFVFNTAWDITSGIVTGTFGLGWKVVSGLGSGVGYLFSSGGNETIPDVT
ncbi:hypothetical protein [Simkania sp.]|uniref:hypothetical protein n=1 Tax=Simkania sp. TaxID=34094 RepID=UPI003B52439C